MSSYISIDRFADQPGGSDALGFARRNMEVLNSAVISFFAVAIIDLAFLLSSDAFKHWFVIPVSVCGILVGTDGVEWLRGRLELFDPAGIIGMLGIHFFYIAPMLHVSWDFWMWEVQAPADWRVWLGFMGVLNAVGLIFYRICRDALPMRGGKRLRTFWRVDARRFRTVLTAFLVFAAILQVGFYASVGGISGYIQTIQDDRMAFKGLGWLFMISESVPILTVFLLVLFFQRGYKRWQPFAAVLLIFVVQMFFGGLRGSRSETVRMLFWAVGCFHLLVRRVPRNIIYGGCAFLVVFLYLYGFYKAMGANATEAFSGDRSSLEVKTRRSSAGMILGDLGRADVQAFVLYKLTTDGRDFVYAKGRTYLGALMLPIPGFLLPIKPETKLQEGTEIGFGPGSYAPGVFWSSRVYGLAGESMLNFGAFAVPFVYAGLGLVVGWFRRTAPKLMAGDARLLLVPFGAYMCFNLLVGDSDNLIFGLIKNGFLPLVLIWICSTRLRLPPRTSTPYSY